MALAMRGRVSSAVSDCSASPAVNAVVGKQLKSIITFSNSRFKCRAPSRADATQLPKFDFRNELKSNWYAETFNTKKPRSEGRISDRGEDMLRVWEEPYAQLACRNYLFSTCPSKFNDVYNSNDECEDLPW